jgi:hypothetical protein
MKKTLFFALIFVFFANFVNAKSLQIFPQKEIIVDSVKLKEMEMVGTKVIEKK